MKCVNCGMEKSFTEPLAFSCSTCGGDLCFECYLGKSPDEVDIDDPNFIPKNTCEECYK